MTAAVQSVYDATLALSQEERVELFERLMPLWEEDEMDDDVEEAWADEIKKRLEEIDSGAVQLISHEEFMASLRAARESSASDA